MHTDYYGGNSNYGRSVAVIIVIIVIIIIICIIIFAFVGFNNNKDRKSKGCPYSEDHRNENSSSRINDQTIDPKCNIASVCRDAFKTGEDGAQKILNNALDFLATNPSSFDPLGDTSNNFNGYPIVIRPGQTVADSVYLHHINPDFVGTRVGELNNSEVTSSTKAILDGAERGHKIVCYKWQGRTKLTLVSKSQDGKLVVASGFHIDSTQ